MEYQATANWSFVAGTYHNSIRNQTNFAGVEYFPSWLQGDLNFLFLKLGLLGGVASGYEKNKLVFLTIPVVQIEILKTWGIDAIVSPEFLGLSLKVSLGVLE